MSGIVIVETLRRHFRHLGYVAALLGIIIIAATMAAIGAPGQAAYEMLSLFALIAGCQLIGPEFSSGTLQLILSKPIQRSTYLLSRLVGVVLAIWIAAAAIFGSTVIGNIAADHDVGWRGALSVLLTAALKVMLVCALLTLFGSFTRSYANVGIYIGLQILFGMIIGLLGMMKNATSGRFAEIGAWLRDHPGVINGARSASANIFPDEPALAFDRTWILKLATNAVVAALLACVIFSRREVPYGAD